MMGLSGRWLAGRSRDSFPLAGVIGRFLPLEICSFPAFFLDRKLP